MLVPKSRLCERAQDRVRATAKDVPIAPIGFRPHSIKADRNIARWDEWVGHAHSHDRNPAASDIAAARCVPSCFENKNG
jgi:hypothetical protein